MVTTVKHLPQDTWWDRSFNVLVPLEIQGKECKILKRGGINKNGSTQAHHILVDGKSYLVPTWSVVIPDKYEEHFQRLLNQTRESYKA